MAAGRRRQADLPPIASLLRRSRRMEDGTQVPEVESLKQLGMLLEEYLRKQSDVTYMGKPVNHGTDHSPEGSDPLDDKVVDGATVLTWMDL